MVLSRRSLFSILFVLATTSSSSSSVLAKPLPSSIVDQQHHGQVTFAAATVDANNVNKLDSSSSESRSSVFSSAQAHVAAQGRIPEDVLAVLPPDFFVSGSDRHVDGKEESLAATMAMAKEWDPVEALLTHAANLPLHKHDDDDDKFQNVPKMAVHGEEQGVEALKRRMNEPVLLWLPELGPRPDNRDLPAYGQEEEEGTVRSTVRWMTEGDKLRLRKSGRMFVDVTPTPESMSDDGKEEKGDGGKMQATSMMAGKANLPPLTHQRHINPILATLSPNPHTNEPPPAQSHMRRVLEKMSMGFYSRYYWSEEGEKSSRWLKDEVAEIIAASPFRTYISLETFTHRFPQPSIIARFEMRSGRNASAPLTILGAHQDSANYLFPLLPAPGADDDLSGTASILEAFRALAQHGFVPSRGPVEFHWYAAEEAGLLGSKEIVSEYKQLGRKDMTAFIARNTTESITFLRNDADKDLTEWSVKLAKEYIERDGLVVKTSELPKGAGSDYMSWDAAGYPAAFATEGDPWPEHGKTRLSATNKNNDGTPAAAIAAASASFDPVLGEFDPYVHTIDDRMDVDDSTGVYSIPHALEFSKYAVAFAVEQAGWDEGHTREDDGDGRKVNKR